MITNVIKHICFIIYTSLKKQSGNNYEYHLWYNEIQPEEIYNFYHHKILRLI